MRASVNLKACERLNVGMWERENPPSQSLGRTGVRTWEVVRLFGWRFTSDGLRQDVKRDLTAFNPPSCETWVSTCIRVIEQLAFGGSVVGRLGERER
jgi:hypothetical protein